MTWLERRILQRLSRNGTAIGVTDEITQTESLDAMTTTASFSPSGRPSLADGDGIAIEWVDVVAGITRYQFGGRLLATDTESDPQATAVPCQGPLGLLANARREADGDLLLTGMTDEEAVRVVLAYVGVADFCGDAYDEGEIHGAGYVLGERADPGDPEDPANLWWRAGDPGSTVVGELDDVFFFKTLEIQNCRIVRLFYDPAPDGTGAYRTYTRGVSRDLFAVHRTFGNPDQITNAYLVRGLQTDCGPQASCSCQVYSKAFDTNPHVGGRAGRRAGRAPRQEYQSDVLQNEAVTEWKLRQLMRRNNRLADEVSFELLNDPNVHPCTVIGLKDSTTYIDADPRYYTVTTVDRHGATMTVGAIGGAAGDEGTVTTGVEKLCNRSEGSDSWSGDGVDPTIEVPPIDPGVSFDDAFGDTDVTEVGPDPVPDTTHPFTACTDVDGMVGTGTTDTGYLDVSAVDDGVWRGSGASSAYKLGGLHGEGGIEEIVMYGGGNAVLHWNETTPYSGKTALNDVAIGTAPTFSVAFEVWLASADVDLQIHLGSGFATLFPSPGNTYPALSGDVQETAELNTENESAAYDAGTPEHTCTHPSFAKTNGGVRLGGGLPTGQWVPVFIGFDYGSAVMRVYYGGPDGGYIESTVACPPFGTLTPAACTDVSHEFHFQGLTEGTSTLIAPSVKLRNISIGWDTCAANADFDPTTLKDYSGTTTGGGGA